MSFSDLSTLRSGFTLPKCRIHLDDTKFLHIQLNASLCGRGLKLLGTSWLVDVVYTAIELAALYLNGWLGFTRADQSALKPSTFPSSTCIDLLLVIYAICAAVVCLKSSTSHHDRNGFNKLSIYDNEAGLALGVFIFECNVSLFLCLATKNICLTLLLTSHIGHTGPSLCDQSTVLSTQRLKKNIVLNLWLWESIFYHYVWVSFLI